MGIVVWGEMLSVSGNDSGSGGTDGSATCEPFLLFGVFGELTEVSDDDFDRDTAEETRRNDLASELCDLRLCTDAELDDVGGRADSSELTVRDPEALGTE